MFIIFVIHHFFLKVKSDSPLMSFHPSRTLKKQICCIGNNQSSKGLTYKYVVNKISILIPNQMMQPRKTLFLPTTRDTNK